MNKFEKRSGEEEGLARGGIEREKEEVRNRNIFFFIVLYIDNIEFIVLYIEIEIQT